MNAGSGRKFVTSDNSTKVMVSKEIVMMGRVTFPILYIQIPDRPPERLLLVASDDNRTIQGMRGKYIDSLSIGAAVD